MLFGALLELLPDPAEWLERFAQAGIPRVRVHAAPCRKHGLRATQVDVRIDGQLEEDAAQPHHEHHEHAHHAHRQLADVETILRALDIPETVLEDALEVYDLLAQAESRAHGQPMEQVHFHEVGSLDAVADIVGVCWLVEELQPDRIVSSPIAVGSGTATGAHGVLPVPAPATAVLLQGLRWYSGDIGGELCTPTGAALLRHFVQRFGGMPPMVVDAMGVGAGHRDLEQTANVLRAFWGEDDFQAQEDEDPLPQVMELCCNLDDMSGEAIAYAQERLWEAKPLDVWTVAAQMKKNRPGVVLHVLCQVEDRERFARILLRHTTTGGVRCYRVERYVLQTRQEEEMTRFGPVGVKHYTGYGIHKTKPEYEDLAQAAKAHGVPLETVRRSVRL